VETVRRRAFITLLSGAAAAWPLAARAQQPERMRRIGVLMSFVASDPEAQPRITAFEKGMRDLGWVEGRNLRTEYRWAPGDDANLLRSRAREVLDTAPDLILANSTPVIAALREQSRTVPAGSSAMKLHQGQTPISAYPRESNDTPREKAFCRVARSVRLSDFAILAAGVF